MSKDYIIVEICENIPNQKFWNEETWNWISNFELATVYPTYGQALEMQLKLASKHRFLPIPKFEYQRILKEKS